MQNQASQQFRQSLQQSVSNNFGDYQVCQQINHGGFGHIFKLKQRRSKRTYALKVLDRSNGQQKKIKNQINIHQSLKNRYILQLSNKFHDQSNYYMVLQYCSKGDLYTYIVNSFKNQGMSIQLVKKFGEQIAKGISYLHKNDIIHNDIKPNNILINQKDQVKICDFGLSTKRKNKQKVNKAKGTLNYLAPQCIFPYDQKVDIWSFGILMYFITTGTLPFLIPSYKQLALILTQQNLKKFQYSPKIPLKLKHLLKNVFVYDSNKRYSITDILEHPFFTDKELILEQQNINQQKISRIRSHASTKMSVIDSFKRTQSLEATEQLNSQTQRLNERYNSKKSRPNSQNKEYQNKKTKQNYMNKILEKKSRIMQRQKLVSDKQNDFNFENTRKNTKIVQKQKQKLRNFQNQFQNQFFFPKRSISPLNTQKMKIKPIQQKNCIIIIDEQGICRQRQQIIEETNKKRMIQFKISPNGKSIHIKCDKTEKFYNLENLPQKYFKQYQTCKKILNSVKNHTPKLQFSKNYTYPEHKQISLSIMYSGKISAKINGMKIETTQKQLQESITFGVNDQNNILKEHALMFQLKSIYDKLIAL